MKEISMKKWSAVIVTVSFVASLFVAPTATVASATTAPACAPKQLTVTAGAWAYNPSTAGTVFQTLPISITNEGGTCVVGGFPKLIPTGIKVTHKTSGEAVDALVEGAAISATKYKMLTLSHGKAAYTYLNLVYPIGDASTVKKWTNSCQPAGATGFTISIVPAKKLLNRHVKATIPKVCTTGNANDLSTGPLSSTSNVAHVTRSTPLTDTTLGAGTQIDVIDMLSSALGYAVASGSGKGPALYYLVRTTNVGNSWTVLGALPLAAFTAASANGRWTVPSIHFVNAKVGYVSVTDGPLFVTDDGGTTWSKVKTPGIWPTYEISANTMFVASDVCTANLPAYGPLQCPSYLSQYRVGTTTPTKISIIPGVGVGKWRAAVVLDALSSTTAVVVEGGTEGSRSSLLATDNGGASWRQLSDPCEGLMVDQLLTHDPGRWLLYCYMGGGMNQGSSELWRSSDGGHSWSIVAKSTEGGINIGGIGDVSNMLYFNNEGTIYGALGGAAGGLEYSSDLGAHWTRTNITTNIYGGAPEYVSVFDAAGAIFGIEDGPQYRTSNGTKWSELPELPAGKYKGHSICTSKRGTTVLLHKAVTSIPAGTLDYPVDFTNDGDVACYLNGIPIAQPVAGPDRRPIGQAAYPAGSSGRGGLVILKAHTGVASIVLESDAASGYPRSYCIPKTMTGLVVRFNPPATFYLSMPRRMVCSGVSTVRNSGVVVGVSTWLGE
jgi:photosystem II stability/assembly factor-like uncharacterized protein